MLFKKKDKITINTSIIPILTKEVFELTNSSMKYEDTPYCNDDAKEMQLSIIESMYTFINENKIKNLKFVYIDDEYLTWVKTTSLPINDVSINTYIQKILENTDNDNVLKRLWDKNAKNGYSMKFLMFMLNNKNDDSIEHYKIKKIPDSVKKAIQGTSKRWVCPTLISQKEMPKLLSRIKDVGEASLNGNHIRLGIIEQETSIINNYIAVLPYIEKYGQSEYKVQLANIEDPITEITAAEEFSNTLLDDIAKSSSTEDTVITPMFNYAIPKFGYEILSEQIDAIDENIKIKEIQYTCQ